jgi:hypothetical protein
MRDARMEWLEPWEPVCNEMAAESQSFREAWESELQTEVAPGRLLYGLDAKLIARRYDCDDALYRLEDGRARVHLIWKRHRRSPRVGRKRRSSHHWNTGRSQDSAAIMRMEWRLQRVVRRARQITALGC